MNVHELSNNELSTINERKLSTSIVRDINTYLKNKTNINNNNNNNNRDNNRAYFSKAIFIDIQKQKSIKEIFNLKNRKKQNKKNKKINNIYNCIKYSIFILCSVLITYSITYLGLEIKHSNFKDLNIYMKNIGDKLNNINYLNNNLKNLNDKINTPDYEKIYKEFTDFSQAIQNLKLNLNFRLNANNYLKNNGFENSYGKFLNNINQPLNTKSNPIQSSTNILNDQSKNVDNTQNNLKNNIQENINNYNNYIPP